MKSHMWLQGITRVLVRACCREGGRSACGLSVQWCGTWVKCGYRNGASSLQKKILISLKKRFGQISPCFSLKKTFAVTLCSVRKGCDMQPCCVSHYILNCWSLSSRLEPITEGWDDAGCAGGQGLFTSSSPHLQARFPVVQAPSMVNGEWPAPQETILQTNSLFLGGKKDFLRCQSLLSIYRCGLETTSLWWPMLGKWLPAGINRGKLRHRLEGTLSN